MKTYLLVLGCILSVTLTGGCATTREVEEATRKCMLVPLETGAKELSNQLTKNMLDRGVQKVAIVDFSDLKGNSTDMGRLVAEELTTQMFFLAPGKFEVVERRKLLKLEEEIKLNMSGAIAENNIKAIGKMLGVDAIVTGTVASVNGTYRVNARVIAVESAKVIAVAATSISLGKGI